MMVDWPYAQLVVDAQEAGGPELFKQSLMNFGYEKGQTSMHKWVGLAAIGGALTVAAIQRLKAYIHKRKEEKCKGERINFVQEVSVEALRSKHFSKRPIIINVVS